MLRARIPHYLAGPLAGAQAPASRALLSGLLSLMLLHPALAAENTATGSIGGITDSLQPSATIHLDVEELELIKVVRSSTGQPLPREAAAGQGSVLWFVIYVNNQLESPLEDLQIEDEVASGTGNFTVEELGSGVHAQAIDLSNVEPGDEEDALTAAWDGAWQDVTDSGSDHGGETASGEYDSGSQTFRFGTSGSQSTVPGKTLRAYRIKVIVN